MTSKSDDPPLFRPNVEDINRIAKDVAELGKIQKRLLDKHKDVRVVNNGAGLANCINVLVESVGKIFGLSRAFFEAGEGMTDGREVAADVTNEVC